MNWLVRTLMHGRALPRVFDPKTHEVLDWLVTGYFLILAGSFWGSHRRAAATALINAGAVAGLMALTDYDGDGRKPVSFETHGKVDLVQAGTASGLPVLLGFGGDAASMPFQAQALNEIVVVSATDWEANERGWREKNIAA